MNFPWSILTLFPAPREPIALIDLVFEPATTAEDAPPEAEGRYPVEE